MMAHLRKRAATLAVLYLVPAVVSAQRIAWLDPIEVAAGPGVRGPWQQNESRYDYVDDPTVAIDDRGAIAVAWVDQARKDVLLQRLGPDGTWQFREPVNVSRNGATFSWLPRIALAPDSPDTVYVLWQEIIFSGGSHGGDILFARSTDGGRTFSEPINLSNSIAGDGKGRINAEVWDNGSLDMVVGPAGRLYAAWTEYEGALWFSRSGDGGRSFSTPVRIAGEASRPARGPSLAASEGVVHVAWTEGESASADIRVRTSADGGRTFGDPKVVHESKGYSDAPKLAVDGKGVLHVVFAESDGGPFGRYHIRYTHSADGGRTFAAPRELMGLASGSADSAAHPALGVDSKGHLYVLWEMFPDYRRRPRGLALTASVDGGRSFEAVRPVPRSADPSGGTNGSHQGLLMQKLAVNRAGDFVVANSSLQEGRRSRVWLMRGHWRGPAGGDSAPRSTDNSFQ